MYPHLLPKGDPGLSNPREEDSLEAMVSSKLLSKCQIQLLIGSSKQIVIQTLIIKRGTGMRSYAYNLVFAM